jgi:hypothetical protein
MALAPQDHADQLIRATAMKGITGIVRHIVLPFRIAHYSVKKGIEDVSQKGRSGE